MSNLVIYRKYRPQTFAQVVGQEHVVRTLQGALRAAHVPHAYIFTGPRGTGKTTLARIFAKALNCGSRSNVKGKVLNVEPCGSCQSCTEITEGRSLDLIEIDAASNRGIDEIRELREGIKFAPMQGKYKMYIIDEFHMLTKEAFNALLKTLEEPPAHAVFVLATTDIAKVPDTILSRALRFDFRYLTKDEVMEELERIAEAEGMAVQKEALAAMAASSGGSLRDGETLLEQLVMLGKKNVSYEDAKDILGFADFHAMIEFADRIFSGKAAEAIALFGEQYEKGEDPEQLVALFIEWVRKMLLVKLDPNLENLAAKDLSPDHLEKLKQHAQGVPLAAIAKIEQVAMDRGLELRRTSFPQLVVELAIVEISELIKSQKA